MSILYKVVKSFSQNFRNKWVKLVSRIKGATSHSESEPINFIHLPSNLSWSGSRPWRSVGERRIHLDEVVSLSQNQHGSTEMLDCGLGFREKKKERKKKDRWREKKKTCLIKKKEVVFAALAGFHCLGCLVSDCFLTAKLLPVFTPSDEDFCFFNKKKRLSPTLSYRC